MRASTLFAVLASALLSSAAALPVAQNNEIAQRSNLKDIGNVTGGSSSTANGLNGGNKNTTASAANGGNGNTLVGNGANTNTGGLSAGNGNNATTGNVGSGNGNGNGSGNDVSLGTINFK